MRNAKEWAIATTVLLLGRRKRGLKHPVEDRIVAPGQDHPWSELAAIGAFGTASLLAIAFILFYAFDSLPNHTQLFGAAMGLCFLCLGAGLILLAERVVPDEDVESEYHETTPQEQYAVEQIIAETGDAFTRGTLLKLAAGGAVGTVGLALITPALSFGPFLDVEPYYGTPWKRGRRLVDEKNRPYKADDIDEDMFYTAFPEGADKELLASSLIVVRMKDSQINLPPDRKTWAPQGILAYSKICTHAACAISMYRAPLFQPDEPKPALVCPCHYSTFDPSTGGLVLFGPAGRALPQLPLMIDAAGFLRAGGNFSEPVGPSWWGVREGNATS